MKPFCTGPDMLVVPQWTQCLAPPGHRVLCTSLLRNAECVMQTMGGVSWQEGAGECVVAGTEYCLTSKLGAFPRCG